MNNNVTIAQNETINNNSQIPYFPQPKNTNMEVIISPYGNPIIKTEEKGNQIVQNSTNDYLEKKKAYYNSQYYKKKIKYKTEPIETICPNCYELMTTKVELTCNGCSILLSIIFTIYYFLVILSLGYDCLCYDAVHTCSKCGYIVGDYDSPGKSCENCCKSESD